jgi:hypothetical protein
LERIPWQFFTNEFKEEAVKLAVEGGLPEIEHISSDFEELDSKASGRHTECPWQPVSFRA